MKRVFSNIVYQSFFQLVKILVQILTVPIVSKALGPDNVGLYKFSNSIVGYFVLFAGLGIVLYGQRQIALYKDDKDKLQKTFCEIETLSIIVTSLSFIVYLVICFIFSFPIVFIIQAISIVSVLLDVSWFFMGIEDFKLPSLRSTLISISTFICIILFIKNEHDLYLYIMIVVGGTFLSQLVMWPFLLTKISFRMVPIRNAFKHLKGAISFFLPTVAITFYTTMNITILGFFSTNAMVGYYSNALVLSTIVTTMITTIDTVMLPKITNLYQLDNKNKILGILQTTLNIPFYFTIPAYFGVVLISEKLVPWFMGDDFLFVVKIIPYLSLLIILKPIGLGISRQYLLPIGRIKEYNFTLVLAAAVGLISNLIFIPLFGIWGAIFTSVFAELVVVVSRMIPFLKETGFKYRYLDFIYYSTSAVIMYGVTYVITLNWRANIFTTILQILIGALIYLLVTTILKKNPVINLLKERNFIFKK